MSWRSDAQGRRGKLLTDVYTGSYKAQSIALPHIYLHSWQIDSPEIENQDSRVYLKEAIRVKIKRDIVVKLPNEDRCRLQGQTLLRPELEIPSKKEMLMVSGLLLSSLTLRLLLQNPDAAKNSALSFAPRAEWPDSDKLCNPNPN